MPYTNFGAPGLGDSCKYTAQTSVHYITQFMLPELQYHDPSHRAWSLHNHLICSHGHCTVVVHVMICFCCFLFDCLQLIVLTPSMASMYFYVQFWCCYYRLFVFISTWYFLCNRLMVPPLLVHCEFVTNDISIFPWNYISWLQLNATSYCCKHILFFLHVTVNFELEVAICLVESKLALHFPLITEAYDP